MGRDERADFLLRPVPSVFERAETHRSAVSQLEGLQHEGLTGFFPFPVSVRRLFLFHSQLTSMAADGLTAANCVFYESIHSVDDLISAVRRRNELVDRGIALSDLPAQLVVTTIFPSIYDAPDGIVPLPEADERSIGDHVVISTGFENGHLYFLNNWGPEWGIQGVGCFPVDYLSRFQREAWAVRRLTGPSPNLSHGFEGGLGPNNERLKKLQAGVWDQHESSNFMVLHRGAVVDVFGRWLIGFSDGSVYLQCIAALHEPQAAPLIVGWMHIRGTSAGADVEEFFVWPPYRERGIGTALAGQALLYAAGTPWQQSHWKWRESEADSIMRERSRWNTRIPSWLSRLSLDPSSAVTNRTQFLSLLESLANAQSLDGVRLLRHNDSVNSTARYSVVDDSQSPSHGVIVKIV